MLERLLRSRAEVAVLGIVLFSDGLHLREIARRAGVSPSEAKHELDALAALGVLAKTAKGNLVLYELNPKCPFISELKGLYLKTEGPIPLLKKELGRLKGLRYAFVYGSFAGGNFTERSDIDLLVIGDVGEGEVDRACFEVQKKTMREINYILWSEGDFSKKLKEGGAFVSSIVKEGKIWLVGDGNEFERDAAKAGNPKGRA
ncbi:MAG: nucleotidyltransferase domain-containing protein [Candidatus Micrarchaeota archaeon]|nr:nucleotidyltransferase domain-containing protein [Candidatus Micrarchaeota archaeon]